MHAIVCVGCIPPRSDGGRWLNNTCHKFPGSVAVLIGVGALVGPLPYYWVIYADFNCVHDDAKCLEAAGLSVNESAGIINATLHVSTLLFQKHARASEGKGEGREGGERRREDAHKGGRKAGPLERKRPRKHACRSTRGERGPESGLRACAAKGRP